MASASDVRAILEPVVSAAGCDLEDVEIRAAGRRQLVRVLIDADGGVSLDTVASVSRSVSDALDAADARLGFGAYVLEVSSPGVDRPLTLPRHFRRAIGRLVRVTLTGGRVVEGRITQCDEVSLTVVKATKVFTVPLADIDVGKVQVEFKSVASAGGSGPVPGADIMDATQSEDTDGDLADSLDGLDDAHDGEDLDQADGFDEESLHEADDLAETDGPGAAYRRTVDDDAKDEA